MLSMPSYSGGKLPPPPNGRTTNSSSRNCATSSASPAPTVPDDEHNAYVFERAVTFTNGDGSTSTGRIDLYKRGCFVLEAKQGSDRPEPDGAGGGGRGGGAPPGGARPRR